jgi:hypothetical protein
MWIVVLYAFFMRTLGTKFLLLYFYVHLILPAESLLWPLCCRLQLSGCGQISPGKRIRSRRHTSSGCGTCTTIILRMTWGSRTLLEVLRVCCMSLGCLTAGCCFLPLTVRWSHSFIMWAHMLSASYCTVSWERSSGTEGAMQSWWCVDWLITSR